MTYAYDNNHRPISATSASGTVNFGYDALGRKVSEAGSLGAMTSGYDAAGRRTSLTWPDGFAVTYGYDALGEVTTIAESGASSGPGVLASYSYDNLGRRTTIAWGDGLSTSYGYDADSRLTALSHAFLDTTKNVTFSLGYTPASQATSRSTSNALYDWTNTYSVNRPYGVNGLNQLTSSGSLNLTYGGLGNLTSDGTNSFTYDTNSNLIGANSATFGYDALNRLTVSNGSATTQFLYDGSNIVAEYDGSGALLRRYVDGPETDEPIVWYEGSGTASRRWLMNDDRHSVIAVADASGALIGANTYDDYGIPGPSNIGRFQFTGQAFIPEAGVYDYKARNYSPTLGRFMQTDPAGYAAGMNWYAYVRNDPINMGDPTGLDGITYTGDSDNGTPQFSSSDIYGVATQSWIPAFFSLSSSAAFSVSPSSARSSLGSHTQTAGTQPQSTTCTSALHAANRSMAGVNRALANWGTLSAAAAANGIDPALLAAVGVRETNFQNVAQQGGGGGMGVFQLTNQPGVSSAQAYNLSFSANYAAHMLSSNMSGLSGAFPSFTPSQLLQATAASYNLGLGGISGNPNTIDVGTTGGNYGSSVVGMMGCFR